MHIFYVEKYKSLAGGNGFQSFFIFAGRISTIPKTFAMEMSDNQERRDGHFSRAVRAGKRTYFFDVKSTRGDEKYLTITESKRKFSNEQGRFFYEKHKLFLYKEDFEKFFRGLNESIHFIETGEFPEDYGLDIGEKEEPTDDIRFEDLP